ncbi:cytochrome P450 [Pseudonocardia nematodicida]|uniref:Cytochrome P450 n=1 Tax=Pseudonocardia nematodicida TaxID=1206997 RepID=A0ABV1K780_9PSEU
MGFTARPHRTLLALREAYGPVVEFGMGPGRIVAVFGPEANAFLFGHDELFSNWEVFETVAPLSGETALLLSDGEAHRRRRRVAASGFTRRGIEGYVPAFTRNADRVIDGWRPGERVDLHQEFRRTIRRATIEVLFGPDLAGDADRIGDMLAPLLSFVDCDAVTQQFQRAVGGRRLRAALAGRAQVDDLVRAELARRSSEVGGPPRDDLLSRFAAPVDGAELTEAEVFDQVVSLVVAAYETTAAAMAWACMTLLRAPAITERIRAEVTGVCGDAPPTAEDLPRLAFLDRVVQETLRLYPPASISGRYVQHGFRLHGHDIDPGTTLLFSPLVTHRDPAVWDRATTFLPDRWDPDGPLYRRPEPGAFIPFGGGPHRCLGAQLAVAELTVLLARLVVRTELDPVPAPVRLTGFLAMQPKDGVPAVVRSLRSL